MIAKKSGLKKKDILYIVDNFLDKIKDAVEKGDKVEIRGFGTFYSQKKKPRNVYSPIAKKTIDVPGKETLSFKSSKFNDKELV